MLDFAGNEIDDIKEDEFDIDLGIEFDLNKEVRYKKPCKYKPVGAKTVAIKTL